MTNDWTGLNVATDRQKRHAAKHREVIIFIPTGENIPSTVPPPRYIASRNPAFQRIRKITITEPFKLVRDFHSIVIALPHGVNQMTARMSVFNEMSR